MELEEAQKLVKAIFPKLVLVIPPGDDRDFAAERGSVMQDGDRIVFSVWPNDYKDIHFDITEMEETDKGWLVQGPQGPTELRPYEGGVR